MDPLPETEAALRLLTNQDSDLADSMRQAAAELAAAAPSALGFSLGVIADGITLTYVTSEPSARVLDAVQYLGGGPCEDAVRQGKPLEFGRADPLDEQSWGLFAQAGAARGVHSTLSLPILREGTVVAGVNLYGARRDTFQGRHDAIAEIFGAWAPGAVSNADLSFSSRLEAVKAPGRIEDITVVEMAVGVFVARFGVSPDAARDKLFESAARAGIPARTLAKLIVDELEKRGS